MQISVNCLEFLQHEALLFLPVGESLNFGLVPFVAELLCEAFDCVVFEIDDELNLIGIERLQDAFSTE